MAELTIQQALELAMRHQQARRFHEAEQLYRQILAYQPEYVEAIYRSGTLAREMGRGDEAVDLFRRAIALKPDFPEAHLDLGMALHDRGKIDDAIAAYQQAILLRPDFAEAHSNLGTILRRKGQIPEAIAAYRRAVTLRPDFPEAFSNLGNALKDSGQLDEAIAAHRQAIALRPQYAEAHNNLGNALRETGQLDDAIAAYRQAIALKPTDAKIYNNLGIVLDHIGQVDQAMANYRKALELNPNLPEAHSNLIFAMHYRPGEDAQAIADAHRDWNARHAEPLRKSISPPSNARHAHSADSIPDRVLRIGYVSPDFRRHAVGHLLVPLLENHNRKTFRVFCYSNVRNPDDMTERFKGMSDVWHNITGIADQNAADLIRSDEIDILVDLAGHTAGNRLLIFARKPAPIQVTYLGYPNTTGMTAIDYRLTDALADPPGMTDALTAEKLWPLPRCAWCYQATDATPDILPRPGGPITFGCLNNFNKVNSFDLELWAHVLAANPGSRLLLLAPRSDARQGVLQTFEKFGVAPARIELLDRLPRTAYLQTFNRIDISLDAYPYHGTATTCESLWMGVPVVTLAGRTHVSRVGVSLLTHAGLGELVADSPDQFIRIATELARDENRLARWRSNLRQQLRQSPLMDANQYAMDVENAYRQMWLSWCAARSSAAQEPAG